jgi:hypothetical protein
MPQRSAGVLLYRRTAYRVLMVWVYACTESLLVAVLMHASYIFSTLIVFAPPTTGVAFLTYAWTFAVVLWVVVAVVASVNRGQFSLHIPAPVATERAPRTEV